MTRYVIDTNVVSELRRKRPCPAVLEWFDGLGNDDEVLISVLTVGELRSGVKRLRRRDPAQAERLGEWVDRLVSAYAGSIVPVDFEVARRWGELSAVRPLPAVDGLLVATADALAAVLVTRNVKDVAGLGVTVVDPFERTP